MPRWKQMTLKERFMEKLPADRDPDECWEWEGFRNSPGYGVLKVAGVKLRAHRVAWELANDQKIPEGMLACHHCDNPPCCNPRHLYVGTHADNARDSLDRGRHVSLSGQDHGRAKVPDSVALEAVLLSRSGMASEKVADFVRSRGYSVHPATCRKWFRGSLRSSALKQSQEDRTLSDAPSNTTCEVVQVESLQGKGEQLCLFTT